MVTEPIQGKAVARQNKTHWFPFAWFILFYFLNKDTGESIFIIIIIYFGSWV